ncbi:MAG: histidine phosphatase family protein [Pseudomonadota bacterium]
MKTLYIIRHGETEWNAEQRMQGRLDSGLTPRGQEQCIANGRLLKDLGGVDELLVSPLGRTRETAFLLNSFLSADIEFEDALVERDCGDWSGLTIDEITTQFPREWDARQRRPFEHRPPGGENVPEVVERIRPLLARLAGRPAARIGIVTHGVTSRALLTDLLALQPSMAGRVRHPNDALYRLEFTAERIEASHFIAGQGPREGLLYTAATGPQPVPPAAGSE